MQGVQQVNEHTNLRGTMVEHQIVRNVMANSNQLRSTSHNIQRLVAYECHKVQEFRVSL